MSERFEAGAPGGNASLAADNTLDKVGDLLQQLVASGGANAAFGEPRTVGDRTIIPAAEVMRGFGFGMGSGEGRTPGEEQAGGGSGGGAGGGTRTRPVAAIVVGPEGVHVEPIIDMTQIWMAAVTAGVFSFLWMRRIGRKVVIASAAEKEPSPRRMAQLLRGRWKP